MPHQVRIKFDPPRVVPGSVLSAHPTDDWHYLDLEIEYHVVKEKKNQFYYRQLKVLKLA